MRFVFALLSVAACTWILSLCRVLMALHVFTQRHSPRLDMYQRLRSAVSLLWLPADEGDTTDCQIYQLSPDLYPAPTLYVDHTPDLRHGHRSVVPLDVFGDADYQQTATGPQLVGAEVRALPRPDYNITNHP